MQLQVEALPIQSPFGPVVTNKLWHQGNPAGRLVVMLPGRGYSCDHPVLYYLRAMALENGFHVLSLKYGFQVAGAEMTPDRLPDLLKEAEAAARMALSRGYREVCYVGKSLGSPLAVQLAQTAGAARTRAILLTPLESAMQEMGYVPTLAVMGTADPLYDTEALRASQGRENVTWRILEGLDHGLEHPGDWRRSAAALVEVTAACADFLCSNGS